MDATTQQLVRMTMTPTQIKRFQVKHAAPADVEWLTGILNRECSVLGTRVQRMDETTLSLYWK